MDGRIKAAVLGEWKGYEYRRPVERGLCKAGERVAGVVERLAGKDWVGEAEVAAGWAAAVGPFLATHSQPVSVRRGVLTVRVVQPSVRYMLEQGMGAEVVARVKEAFGEGLVREVVFTTV